MFSCFQTPMYFVDRNWQMKKYDATQSVIFYFRFDQASFLFSNVYYYEHSDWPFVLRLSKRVF